MTGDEPLEKKRRLLELVKEVIREFCVEKGITLFHPFCFVGSEVCNFDFPGAGELSHFHCGVKMDILLDEEIGAVLTCLAKHCPNVSFSISTAGVFRGEESEEELRRKIKETLGLLWEAELAAMEKFRKKSS